jgi:RNA polymerase I-specific transcription initiation factor RRN3
VELDDLDPDDWENRSSQVDDSDSSVDSSADDLELDFDSDDDLTITPVSLNFKDLLLKLDTMIDHLMNMVSMRLKEDHEFFQELLTIFDSLILSTHRLRCVQYLYFYIASLQDSFADDFMGLLAGKILDFSQPIVTRIAAASYLASFVARAKFIDQVSAKACIRLLNQCALKYLDSYNGGLVTRKTIVNHGIFYSMVQAIMYLFCFRWKQLIDLNASTGQLPIELASFQRVLTSKLCPFKVCSKHIIEEFARITHSYNMLYCYPFMSSDMRIPGSNEIVEKTDSEKVTTSLVLDRLESFFPFDPLHLPISKKRIAVIYQEWEDNDQDEIENLDHQLSGTSFE